MASTAAPSETPLDRWTDHSAEAGAYFMTLGAVKAKRHLDLI
jgi:hypothetical protein